MAQPNWCAADSVLLLKLGEALADIETGPRRLLAFEQATTSSGRSDKQQAPPGTSRGKHGAIDAPRPKPGRRGEKSVSGNPA